ncbi:hypothetical protein TNCV_3011821 [Trichonephila clavipes]|nr:hypothetical protein TNCV_3011821 [Trichonephila clavipes]
MPEQGGNRLVPGSDYMGDALKLSNQALRASGESVQVFIQDFYEKIGSYTFNSITFVNGAHNHYGPEGLTGPDINNDSHESQGESIRTLRITTCGSHPS